VPDVDRAVCWLRWKKKKRNGQEFKKTRLRNPETVAGVDSGQAAGLLVGLTHPRGS
jgi:hypothetical protein